MRKAVIALCIVCVCVTAYFLYSWLPAFTYAQQTEKYLADMGSKFYREAIDAAAASIPDGYDGGSYVLWTPMVFTYKDYTGAPAINDPAFEAISKAKYDNGDCYIFATKYRKTADNELAVLVNQNDPEAVLEKTLRNKPVHQYFTCYNHECYGFPIFSSAVLKAAIMGNIQAKLIITSQITHHYGSNDETRAIIQKYQEFTPQALIIPLTMGDIHNADITPSLEKLKTAGGYCGGMAVVAAHIAYKNEHTDNVTEEVQNEYLCEAYFMGDFYLAERYTIDCQ